jgi:hypothetical protein
MKDLNPTPIFVPSGTKMGAGGGSPETLHRAAPYANDSAPLGLLSVNFFKNILNAKL